MPPKRRTVRRRKPRTYRRKTRKTRRTPLTHNLGYLLPDRLRIKLPYVENIVNYAAAATPIEYTFNANDLYDPNRSGVGHQPMIFDQIAAFYDRYYVSACSFRADLISGSSGIYTGSGVIMVIPNNSITALTATLTPTIIMEQEKLRKKYFSNNGGSKDRVTLTHYQTTKRMPVAPGRYSYDASAAVGAQPVDGWYWHVIIASQDDASTISASVRYKLVFSCEFSQRKMVASS